MSVVRIVAAVVIMAVWATVYLLAAFSEGRFAAPPELSAVMIAAATYLFGGAVRSSLRDVRRQVADAIAPPEPPEPAKPAEPTDPA